MPTTFPRRYVLRAGVLASAAVWLAPALSACSDPDDSRLVFLNWQDYIDPTLLDDFSDRSGLVVTYETYASNDELADRLRLADVERRRGREGTSFDLIVPSNNLLRRLRSFDLLQELDPEIVTNLGNLDEAFRRSSFDPGNRFSVPWATGTSGIGYDSTVFPEPPDWNVFLDQEFAGRMTILDEMREAFGLALFALGEDPNTRDASAIDAAADLLIQMKGVIAGFDSATYLDRLESGEVVCAHGYSSDVLQARDRDPNLAFTLPVQGALRWIDSLCVPAEAPNPEGANRFIAFYLEPEVSAANAVATKIDTGNLAARDFISAEVLEDPVIFPPPEDEARLVFAEDLGDDEALYEEAWARVEGA